MLSQGRASILIIEDGVVAADLQGRLIALGYSARLVATGQDALAALEATSVDLILLSLMLPDTDGLILCTTLRSRTNAPIIVLSPRPRDVDRLFAMELGATDF